MIAKSSSKRDTNLKWLFFPLAVFGGFVFAYSYDTPSSVKDLLHNHFKHQYSESEFEVRYSFLYSLMALPNVFLTVFLGVLIDKVSPPSKPDFQLTFVVQSEDKLLDHGPHYGHGCICNLLWSPSFRVLDYVRGKIPTWVNWRVYSHRRRTFPQAIFQSTSNVICHRIKLYNHTILIFSGHHRSFSQSGRVLGVHTVSKACRKS